MTAARGAERATHGQVRHKLGQEHADDVHGDHDRDGRQVPGQLVEHLCDQLVRAGLAQRRGQRQRAYRDPDYGRRHGVPGFLDTHGSGGGQDKGGDGGRVPCAQPCQGAGDDTHHTGDKDKHREFLLRRSHRCGGCLGLVFRNCLVRGGSLHLAGDVTQIRSHFQRDKDDKGNHDDLDGDLVNHHAEELKGSDTA